jgi:hypothetical protein
MDKYTRRTCKPLASKAGQKLFPICFVDCHIATAGPPIYAGDRAKLARLYDKLKSSRVHASGEDLMHQSRVAGSQWGNAKLRAQATWLKSWYFPIDAFRPWPQESKLCCWWCTEPFSWTPFPLPYQYDRHSNRYRSIGMFCGPSCAKSYAANVKRYENIDNVFRWIETIATDSFGYRIGIDEGGVKRSSVPFAPDRELLQKFCGPEGMTIEEFRSACDCGRCIELLEPNWITQKQIVQAEQIVAKMGRAIYHREDPDHIQRTQDLVRVKRIPFAGIGARRISDYLYTPS